MGQPAAIKQGPDEVADLRVHAVLHAEHRDRIRVLGLRHGDIEDAAADRASHARVVGLDDRRQLAGVTDDDRATVTPRRRVEQRR